MQTVLEELKGLIQEDEQNGYQPVSILFNESALALLLKEDSDSVMHIEKAQAEGEDIYQGEVNVGDEIFLFSTLPDFHPNIQHLFQIFNQDPIQKHDTEEVKEEKKYAVYVTLDKDGNMIL